jgi:aspartate/methionine/tyrosine aminotransferase
MVKVAGGEVVAVQTKYENRYCMTAEELRAALTEKTRMLILCSPNNPTGSVYSYEELKAIVAVLREYPQVVVLSDEIYNALVYSDEENKNNKNTAYADINIDKKNTHSTPAMSDGPRGLERNHPQALTSELAAPVDANTPNLLPDEQHVECLQKCVVPPCENDKNIVCSMAFFAEIADRLIIVNGVSKAYAMTGWRIGWPMSKDKAFIEACTRLQGQQVTCATMVAQKAAEAALTGSQECVVQMRQVFAERRELICRLAAEIPGLRFEKPQGAFYLFPDVSALGGGDKIAEYLLEEAHVAVVSGSAFGCPECIRLSYAISTEEIAEAMRRIQVAITRIVNKQK